MINQLTRAAACIVAALFLGCHPAKQLQKQDQDISALKAKWVGDWVKDHPCPELPPMNLDSICGLHDFDFDIKQSDTVRHDTIAGACQPVVRRILVPYLDTRTTDQLYDSLRTKTERLAMLEGRQEAIDQDNTQKVISLKESRNTWLWAFIAACVVILAFIVKDIYGFFKG